MKEGDGHTVLVVDDDPALRMLCRINLERDGYTVLEAGTVDDAAASAGEADVILLDVRMGAGVGDGLSLLDRLPEPRPGVALLTGSVDLTAFEKPVEVDAIISKPFALEDLATVVRELAAR